MSKSPTQESFQPKFLGITVSVPASISVEEGEGTVQVCATLSTGNITEGELTFTMTTSDRTGL